MKIKLVLLIILFPIIMMGQGWQSKVINGDTVWIANLTDSKQTPKPVSFEEHLLTLLQDYQRECYADSERVDLHKLGFEFSPFYVNKWHSLKNIWGSSELEQDTFHVKINNPNDCGFTIKYRWYYRHREPSFQGFIEFIKRRVK